MTDKIVVKNINESGRTSSVNKVKYWAVREVFLNAAPKNETGITQKEMLVMVQPHLSQNFFPKGAKSSWRMKKVQLDLEARNIKKKGIIKPLTWHQL